MNTHPIVEQENSFDQVPDSVKVNLLSRYCISLTKKLEETTLQVKEFELKKYNEITHLKQKIAHLKSEVKRTVDANQRLYAQNKKSSDNKMASLFRLFCGYYNLSEELERFRDFVSDHKNNPTDFFKTHHHL